MTPPVADEKWGQIQAQQDIPTPTIESIPIPIVNPSPGSEIGRAHV